MIKLRADKYKASLFRAYSLGRAIFKTLDKVYVDLLLAHPFSKSPQRANFFHTMPSTSSHPLAPSLCMSSFTKFAHFLGFPIFYLVFMPFFSISFLSICHSSATLFPT